MIRNDGSVKSNNSPGGANDRYMVRDYGLHLGFVRSASQPGLPGSISPVETVYEVQIVGGDKNGQIFKGVVLARALGGRQNQAEVMLKPSVSPLLLDIGTEGNLFDRIGNQNGDFVYMQFVSGNILTPVITGFAKHPLDSNLEYTDTIVGQHKRDRWNGVESKIDEHGQFSWTKDNGLYLPLSVNLEDPLNPYVAEFAPLPGQSKAISVSMGNLFDFAFDMNVDPLGLTKYVSVTIEGLTQDFNVAMLLGTQVNISGITDSITLSSAAGTGLAVSGFTDSVDVTTLVGTTIGVSGVTDSISLASFAGAAVSISGLTDTVEISTLSGASAVISPTSAFLGLPSGTALDLSLTGASLLDPTGAGFKVEAGRIAMGNAAAELLDLIDQAFTALSTQTAAGFGAPTSTIADFIQLAVKIKLIKGSL